MNTRLLFVTVLGFLGTQASAHAQTAAPAPTSAPVAAPQPIAAPPAVLPEPYVPPLTPPGATVVVPPGTPLYVAPGMAAPQPVQPAPARRMTARPVRGGLPQWEGPREPRRHGDAGAPFALGIGGDLLWRNDRASHLLQHQKTLGAFDAFVTYDLWSARRVIIAVGASLRTEAQLGSSQYQLRNNTVQADAMARFGVASWFWPHIRVGIGGVTSHFERYDNATSEHLGDRNGSVAATFGGGFTVRTPTRMFETHRGRLASLSFGVLVEAGYTIAKDASFTLKPHTTSDIALSTFSIGNIGRSAAYTRLAGVIRF